MSKQRPWRTQLAREPQTLSHIAARYDISLRVARRALASQRRKDRASEAWRAIAHDAQLPPQTAWATWLFQGGRGAGKTRAGAEWLAARAEETPGGVFALVGPTHHDVREVMIDGVSGLRRLPNRTAPRFESSRQRLVWPNGAVAYAFSAHEPERLRGPQFDAAWADEFCVWPKPAEVLANLRLALRRGDHPQLVVTTTPKPLAILRKLRAEPACVTTQAPTARNAAHLPPPFLAHVRALYGGTRLEHQELEGLIVDAEGTLFPAEHFARLRAPAPARFDRVVVAVDPPATRTGSACGIVVAGAVFGEAPRAYVLEDASAAGLSPLGWAVRVVDAARRWEAHAIVAESNQGGDMVRTVLTQAAPPCPIRLVHASEGKRARAEPIALLYEQGRILHCAELESLEQELIALGAGDGAQPSDRADAAVWALSDLMLTGRSEPRILIL